MNSIDGLKYLVFLLKQDNKFFNKTKCQKLLYLVYGVYAAYKNERLFDEEPLYLPYGPVFSNALNYCNSSSEWAKSSNCSDIDIDNSIQEVFKLVVSSNFANWSAEELVSWSHRAGSSWERAQNKGFSYSDKLSFEDIVLEFTYGDH